MRLPVKIQTWSLAIILLITESALAQPYFDIANVQFMNSPDKSFSGAAKNPSSIQYLAAQIGLPIQLKENILLFNPFFESYTLKFTRDADDSKTVYSSGIPVTFLKQWKNEKWKTAFVFIPRINSDFKNISGNDYQFGGVLLSVYKKKETLKYKFGIYYNGEFFGPFFMLLAGIDWNINERLNLFGILPGSLVLEYKISKVVYVGLNFKSITNSYRFNYSPYMKVTDNHLKIFIDYYLAKNFVISVEGGHSSFRKYTFENTSGTATQNPYNDGILLKASLSYRIRLDEKK